MQLVFEQTVNSLLSLIPGGYQAGVISEVSAGGVAEAKSEIIDAFNQKVEELKQEGERRLPARIDFSNDKFSLSITNTLGKPGTENMHMRFSILKI